MYFVKVLTISSVLGSLLVIGNADPVPRLANGEEIDDLRQFPHHVSIDPYGTRNKCGGSILNAKWILTSAACIRDSVRVEITFGRKNNKDTAAGYYTISVNKDQIFVYPTNSDDLALVKLPMPLVFTETIKPVEISRATIAGLRNKFATLPGFNEPVPVTENHYLKDHITPVQLSKTIIGRPRYKFGSLPGFNKVDPVTDDHSLKYGMFNVLESRVCKQKLGAGLYDEYSQLCTEAWGSNLNTPCDSDFGSGLIVGWPAKNELIGMFSMLSPSCDNTVPAIYTYVPKYLPWIESMIRA